MIIRRKIRIYLKSYMISFIKCPVDLVNSTLILAINVRDPNYLIKPIIGTDLVLAGGSFGITLAANRGELIAITTTDVHPPLYYAVMHAFA